VNGNPVNWTDPEGLRAIDDPLVGWGAGGGGGASGSSGNSAGGAGGVAVGIAIGAFIEWCKNLVGTPPVPSRDQCTFEFERYWGGQCKTCVYKCTGWAAPVTYPQANGKPCPSIRPDGLVNTDEIDPICRPKY
jgi:hypothetical protein